VNARRAQMEEFLTISEVAERLKVNERTVRRWIESGDLKAHKIGNCVRISLADLHEFLDRTRT
jgi:excisionase family DNA binding protein